MNKSMIQSGGYVLLAGLILAMSSTLFAADNNLHFSGNLLSKSCALVVDGQYLAEVRFPTVSRQDLNVAGQSARVPVVFKLKDCKGPAGYNVKVTLTGVAVFWHWIRHQPLREWELAWKKPTECRLPSTIQMGRPLR